MASINLLLFDPFKFFLCFFGTYIGDKYEDDVGCGISWG